MFFLASAMCVPRGSSVLVVLVLMMVSFLRCSVEAMPQCPPNQDHIISAILDGERISEGCEYKCVKFHDCADLLEEEEEVDFLGLVDERTKNVVINATGGPCRGLNICCQKEIIKCTKPIIGVTPIVPIPPPATPEPPHQWKCGKRNADGVRIIVNGFTDGQTQLGEFPWMVAVLGKDTLFIGGGSLVHPRAVLTAGHKVHEKPADSLVARVGDWDISKQEEHIDPQNIDVEQVLFHPNFNRQKHEYNVAILILKTEATYGETVAPVCLPQPGQNFDNMKNCFVTGWGKNDFDKGQYQTIMKKVELPMVSNSKCQAQLRNTRLGSTFELHNSFVCAGGHKEDACTGDGGSPLVCPGADPKELVQVGVVSWGIGCGIVGNPGVYGSVPAAMDWITPTIQNVVGIDVDVRLG